MITLTYLATFTVAGDRPDLGPVAVSGPSKIVTERTREGDRLENVLVDDLRQLLSFDWAPRYEGDSLKLELRGVWHTAFGIRTFPAHRRHLRRAAERLWPETAPVPEPPVKAAFELLLYGTAAIRMKEWGLSVTRK